MTTMSKPGVGLGLEETPSSHAIVATSVSKSFAVGREQLQILHGVSLQVDHGEMVAIMGPSGSGKSTLMYCLAGLEQPTAGQVWLNGLDLKQQSRAKLAKMRRSEIGFVFQSFNLIPTLTTYENVALPYLLSGQKPPREKLVAVLEEVGLGHRMEARPPSMSGGEQQRAALARVLAQEPRIIFADEPTGSLDSTSGEVVLTRLADISHQDDRAVLMVTHDPAVAARCDRALFLRDGRLVEELRPRSVAQVADTLARLTAQSTRKDG
ncbi:MAG: ABC transporter ATP-binding protein [Propionibacteriaceae bacterium]|nr:ABC transporter ATP-binding protein [Propionibacteriaceae bacterium]